MTEIQAERGVKRLSYYQAQEALRKQWSERNPDLYETTLGISRHQAHRRQAK